VGVAEAEKAQHKVFLEARKRGLYISGQAVLGSNPSFIPDRLGDWVCGHPSVVSLGCSNLLYYIILFNAPIYFII
jgi:hypothetical protein